MGEVGTLDGMREKGGRRVLFDQSVELGDLAVVVLFGLCCVQNDHVAA